LIVRRCSAVDKRKEVPLPRGAATGESASYIEVVRGGMHFPAGLAMAHPGAILPFSTPYPKLLKFISRHNRYKSYHRNR
jgi:hypothetical protein